MKIQATQHAAALIDTLKKRYGKIIFHLSGGCCDGSSPTTFREADFQIGANDRLVGELCNVPFYMGQTQYEFLQEEDLTIDVVSGFGSGFSLESPEGKCFILRSEKYELK